MNSSNLKNKSFYDLDLKDCEGNPLNLNSYRGKVVLITNVTGHCGNAPQFGIIEKLYETYKDRGFEVIAVPTNDYCGAGVTYGIYEKGIRDAKMAEDYGRKQWNVTFPFSELVVSRKNRGDEEEKTPHELYDFLNPAGEESPINGNFEKFILNKNGQVALRLPNFVLLEFAYNDGLCDSPETELNKLKQKIEELLDEPYIEDDQSHYLDIEEKMNSLWEKEDERLKEMGVDLK